MSKSPDIAVLGAGAFGTALASVVARRGDPVFFARPQQGGHGTH